MKRFRSTYVPFIFAILFLISCKSEFERIRTSADTETIYQTAMKYYEQGEYLKAQTLFELVISVYRGKKEAEELYFKYAYTHYHQEQYILAAYYFNNFSQTFGTSDYREEAMFMTGFCNYQLSPSFRLDQAYTKKAIQDFQLFVNTYPTSSRVQECNRLIDQLRAKLEQKAIAQAQLYYDMKQYNAAVESFTLVLQDFPESKEAPDIGFRQIKAAFAYAENSYYTKQKERYQQTRELADAFLQRYPSSQYRADVNQILTETNEQLKQLSNG